MKKKRKELDPTKHETIPIASFVTRSWIPSYYSKLEAPDSYSKRLKYLKYLVWPKYAKVSRISEAFRSSEIEWPEILKKLKLLERGTK